VVESRVRELSTEVATEVMGLRVAGLGLWLDSRGSGVHLKFPASHAGFLETPMGAPGETVRTGDLVLRVRKGHLPVQRDWPTRLCLTEIWELWLDEVGRYVFVAPRVTPPRWAVVDPDFAAGEVLGDFGSNNGEGTYPLKGLDIRIFANWLASKGDVLLHAAGVSFDGNGYAFVGSGGAGKSTLAAALGSNPSVTVLGEDQVVLRYLDDRFWIFGTPWHANPAFRSPQGVPLTKLFFLDRTAVSGVGFCGPTDGVARLLQTAFVPYCCPTALPGILDRMALLAGQVPFYTLSYPLGADVLKLIREV
jgi:hypothetical protein